VQKTDLAILESREHADNVASGPCPQTECEMCSLQPALWDKTTYKIYCT